VFAFTMASMAVSELRVIGQIGSTIGLGLMFDTLIVRSFMTPSLAALLGRWFWWPQIVRPRPASYLLESAGSRSMVRSLLSSEQRAPVADDDTQPLQLVESGHRRQVRVPDRFASTSRES
jgi:putative drug exporter of the RND superfamily